MVLPDRWGHRGHTGAVAKIHVGMINVTQVSREEQSRGTHRVGPHTCDQRERCVVSELATVMRSLLDRSIPHLSHLMVTWSLLHAQCVPV
jgi:hypothetical protein